MPRRCSLPLLLFLACAPLAAAADPPVPPPAPAAELARRIKPSVVTISPDNREGISSGIGTGFLISADGLVATNFHVIGEGRKFRVELAGGQSAEVVEIVAWDRDADLAIVRISGGGYPALPLAEDAVPPQGTPVVVMGNPQGLRHSVVEGVLSATREIEGRNMLQLAIPIEPGNSGGPVLDAEGRVLGVVTLKSALTENLGFAIPVAVLRKLQASPNPVAMSHWLTIGVLNPKRWQTTGGEWTQRAGIIRSRGRAGGFGGRTLCISRAEPPALPCEVSVEVRLGDESGAAGLAFCSDGGDVHYGFYPTAGGLRLTRFNGPDVYSWAILQDVKSSHYRPGDWNHLRVRIEQEQIICWLNDVQVFTSSDTGLRSGRPGLCSFRGTAADFRAFRTGPELSGSGSSPALQEIVRNLGQGAELTPAARAAMAAEADNAALLAAREATALEQRAASLRRAAASAREAATLAALKAALSRENDADIPLAECALLLAKIENPGIDTALTLEELDRMGTELGAALTEDDKSTPQKKLLRLNRWMFEENGFHGSTEEMANPANSWLNEVIDDREGIPLTLAIVHMELSGRIGLKVAGIPFPGYFMARLQTEDGADSDPYIDVFDRGRLLTRDEARQRVYDMFGALPPENTHMPATRRSMILRMVANLIAWAMDRQEMDRLTRWLDIALELDPRDATTRLQRALVRSRTGMTAAAREDVEELLRQHPDDISTDRLESLLQDLNHSAQ